MLSVCSPLQVEVTSSYPFHTEIRPNLSTAITSQSQQYPQRTYSQYPQYQSSVKLDEFSPKQPISAPLTPPNSRGDKDQQFARNDQVTLYDS
ncbi:hypothetical protein BGW38_000978, partial [Lunasporangiospora selenospora]